MNLFALDADERLCPAHAARRGQDYWCQDCGGLLHLREGTQRRPHFFHLQGSSDCRLSQKSPEHMQVQLYLERLLGCALEQHFPQIRRIADAVWEEQRLVIEVQCSPISRDEVEARNRDYNAAGYDVLWLLHQKNFNKYRRCAAELFLDRKPHYFTDMDSEGQGELFDQVSRGSPGLREERSPRLPIDLRQLQRLGKPSWRGWSLYVAGDAVDRGVQPVPQPAILPWPQRTWQAAQRLYIGVLHLLLEGVCR